MAYDESTATRVRRMLSKRRGGAELREMRMLGGLAFLVNGSMCCSVGADALLVRVDAEGRDGALARPHVTPMKMGRRTMTGFVRVAPEGYRTEAALARWIERGIAAGATAKVTAGRTGKTSAAAQKDSPGSRARPRRA